MCYAGLMQPDVPIGIEVVAAVIAGAAAGTIAGAITGTPKAPRAAGAAVTFGLMVLAWRSGKAVKNELLAARGLPPA